jgi:hypothetical protein
LQARELKPVPRVCAIAASPKTPAPEAPSFRAGRRRGLPLLFDVLLDD